MAEKRDQAKKAKPIPFENVVDKLLAYRPKQAGSKAVRGKKAKK